MPVHRQDRLRHSDVLNFECRSETKTRSCFWTGTYRTPNTEHRKPKTENRKPNTKPLPPALPTTESALRPCRDEILARLRRQVEQEGCVLLRATEEWGNTTGIGRTFLADELVRRWGSRYTHVFRWRGDTELNWRHGLLQAARTLGLPEQHLRRPDDAVTGVRRWLLRNDGWLVIIDDLTDWDRVRALFNGIQEKRVIVITDLEQPSDSKSPILLTPPLPTPDAVEWLLSAQNSEISAEDRRSAELLVETLERRPVAIRTAAGLCGLTGMSPRKILDRYLTISAESVAKSETPLVRWIRLVLRILLGRHPESAAPLALIAQLDGHDLPESWLLSARSKATSRAAAIDPIAPLIDVGLIQQSENRLTVSPGIQAAVEAILGREDAEKHVARIIAQLLPEMEHVGLDDSLVPQLNRLAEFTIKSDWNSPAVVRFLEGTAVAVFSQGDARRAAVLWQRIVELQQGLQNVIGTAVAYKHLGDCRVALQCYVPARKAYRASLGLYTEPSADLVQLNFAIAEADLYECHLQRAARRLENARRAMRELEIPANDPLYPQLHFLQGASLLAVGRAGEAKRVLERSIRLRPDAPADDVEVLKTRTVLARALFHLKDFTACESLLRKCMEIREKSPRTAEVDRIVPVNFLAEALFIQGRYAEAEPLFERVLAVREELFGPEHRLVGETVNRLAVLKSLHGAYHEAEPLFRRTLSIAEKNYGETHPEVGRVLNDVAESLYSQGKHDQARRLLDRALGIQEKTLRPNDLRVARSRSNLAACYVARGHYEEAGKLYHKDLEAKRKSFPPESLVIATAANNLGEVWRSLGNYAEAETLFAESLQIRQNILGKTHPLVAQSLSNLGYVYLQQQSVENARPYFERALQIREAALDKQHPQVATTVTSLAEIAFLEGEYDQARKHYERALEICEAVYGEKNSLTASVATALGRTLIRLGRTTRAELLLLKSRSTVDSTVGPNHRYFAQTLIGLGELYETSGKHHDAAPLFGRALTIQTATTASALELAQTRYLLGTNLLVRGQPAEALQHFEDCLALRKSILGETHRDVASVLAKLGAAYVALKKPVEAEQCLLTALAQLSTPASKSNAATELARVEALGQLAEACAMLSKFELAESLLREHLSYQEQRLGPEHPDLAPAVSQLAGLMYLREQFEEVEPLVLRCITLCEKKYGPEHTETARHIENLAGIYFLQGRLELAEPLIARAIKILEKRHGAHHRTTTAALENYAMLLRKLGRDQDATVAESRVEEAEARESHVLDL